jgi:acetamidase/formamidase
MTTHHFSPSHYHNTFGSHPAALRVRSGDTVVTTTIDAHGLDARGLQAAEGPNPQTGPFYVEGAQPGDTLQVHLDHLQPNRDTGWSYTVLAPHIIDAQQVHLLPESQKIEWQFDAARKMGVHPPVSARLNRVEFALSPMLGCLGVAPENQQAISSATSGPYGGNMDYRGLVAGATLSFPVFAPGALLHLGDGHALQGDGEVVGTGIETSFDVRFTLNLIKGKRISWPRGENEAYIFTIGNARPLEQALQHATTEMLTWLQEDYGLSVEEASTLLGMSVRYDLGNIFDPAYTMVCKLPKQILAAFKA